MGSQPYNNPSPERLIVGQTPLSIFACGLLLFLWMLPLERLEGQQRWDELEYPSLNPFERPEVEVTDLENGIRLYLLEDRELPLIHLHALVRTGGILVPDEVAGLEQILAEVMRSGGSRSVPADSLNELLEDRAARLESNIGFSSGRISLNVLREDFPDLLPVFTGILTDPALPEDQIELAKTRLNSRISRRNDTQSQVANREFRRLIYGSESVYGRNVEYRTVAAITREQLADLHRRSFTGKNIGIGVTGDFDMEEMKALLSETFGAIPAGEQVRLEFPDVDYRFRNEIHFIDRPDVNQSHILIGHIGGMRDNPDYAALQVMNRVLSGGFSGRLFRIVRSEMGLAYAVFGSYGSQFFHPGIFSAGVLTRSAATTEAIRAVLEQIERLQRELIAEEELEHTIERFLNTLIFEYESRASILQERMSYDYAGMPPDTFDRLVEEIRSVTREDVMRVARAYLQPGNVQILVVGNSEEIGDRLEAFGEVNRIDITIPDPPESGGE